MNFKGHAIAVESLLMDNTDYKDRKRLPRAPLYYVRFIVQGQL